jgi:hypothetical protein
MQSRLSKSNRVALVVMALACVLVWRSAEAQPGVASPPQPASMKDRIKRKILAFRAFRVTEELSLDEVGAARVFPLLAKYDQQVEQLTIERMTINRLLRQRPTSATADDLIKRTLANRRALLELDERRIAELRKVLTAEQTMRLMVVLPEVERQIKEQIRRSARKQGRDSVGGDVIDPFGGKKGRGRQQRHGPAELEESE